VSAQATQTPKTPEVFVFGGSFNPPHVAHTLLLCAAKAMANPERLIVIPTFQHPFAKSLAPYEHRLAMCELAFGWIPGVSISTIEQELGGESKTLRTLEKLAEMHPAWRLRLLIGSDILTEASKWFGWDRIVELAPPFVLGRKGVMAAANSGAQESERRAFLPEVSSTQVRHRLANGEDVSDLLPKTVMQYVRAHDLFAKA
jgi:nicotinate-nucleotide adenylyltransferase